MDLEQFEELCETFDNKGATIGGIAIALGGAAALVWLEFPVWATVLMVLFGAFMIWPKRVYAFVTTISSVLPTLKK